MRSPILALFSVVVLALSMEAVAGSRAAQLDVRRTSRGLKQFVVTSTLTPTDTFAVFEDPVTGRTYVQVVGSPLFDAEDGPSALSKIVGSVFKALQGGVKGGGKILEKVVEKAKEDKAEKDKGGEETKEDDKKDDKPDIPDEKGERGEKGPRNEGPRERRPRNGRI